MRTAVRESSIDCYYSHVLPNLEPSQNERVMAVIRHGRDYSLTELMQLVRGIDKSSMSRVVNTLRNETRLECAPMRKCSITGRLVTPSKLPAAQLGLFQ